MQEPQTPRQQTDTEEIRLEEMLKPSTSGFVYVRTFAQQAIMDPSPEMRACAIRNLRDIGEYLPGKPKIIEGYEKYRRLYLRIKTTEKTQEAYVCEIPSRYETESSTQFVINGNQ